MFNAKNQHAKEFGIQTGEAIWQAQRKCPELVLFPPDFPKYPYFSKRARQIYADYTDQVKPFGLDECWLDVSGGIGLFGSGMTIAQEISGRIKAELGVTVSIGVSWNKIFAKLSSDYKKPDAITVFHHENDRDLIWPLPVGDLLHVSPSTERKLRNMAVFTKGTCWCYNRMDDRRRNHSYADPVGGWTQVCSRPGAGCPSVGFAQSRWSYDPRREKKTFLFREQYR